VPSFDLQLPSSVLVAGSRGVLGHALVSALQGCNVEVYELDLSLGHDLRDESFVEEWFDSHSVEAVVNLFAVNDHVSTAASASELTFLNVPLKQFSSILETNVTALYGVCRNFLTRNPWGVVVNFASIYGVTVPPRGLVSDGEKNIAYGVSKAAVIQLTRHLAVYAAPRARVNCVVLGGVEHEQPLDFVERYQDRVPVGRMAKPVDVLGAVFYLISNASGYVTGSTVTVDGGWTIV